MRFLISFSLFVFAILISSSHAFGLPEYAVRYNVNSCTACHLSPVGGGPRNLNGKLFGAGGFEMNAALKQDYVSADLRGLFYYPQESTTTKGGLALMSGSVAGHVAIDAAKRIHAVIEHNIAGFAAAPYRDTYVLFKLAKDGVASWFDTVMVGRFRVPFGIMTDEHRTYVRFQNQTRWFDFETGALLSGNPSSQVHYDLAVVNGEKQTGQSFGSGQALRWGSVANVRWMPGAIAFGVSGSFHDHEKADESRKSASVYSVLSVDRWTQGRVPVTIEVEHAMAWNWNSTLAQGFVSDQAYGSSVSKSSSRGWLALVQWDLTRTVALLYKYDLLTPDRDYSSDFYARHGVGVRWRVGPNALLHARVEVAQATPPTESKGDSIARQNAAFGIFQVGF